jgi:hypothetical protein
VERCELDSPDMGYGSVMGCFEHNNKSVDSMKEYFINNQMEY